MTAPKPSAYGSRVASGWLVDHVRHVQSDADSLGLVIDVAREAGRREGIEAGAKIAEQWLRDQAGDDEAGEIGFAVRELLQPLPPTESKPAVCKTCRGSGNVYTEHAGIIERCPDCVTPPAAGDEVKLKAKDRRRQPCAACGKQIGTATIVAGGDFPEARLCLNCGTRRNLDEVFAMILERTTPPASGDEVKR